MMKCTDDSIFKIVKTEHSTHRNQPTLSQPQCSSQVHRSVSCREAKPMFSMKWPGIHGNIGNM